MLFIKLSPLSTLVVRRGSDVLDCEPVLMESDRVCCTLLLLLPPLSFYVGKFIIVHVSIFISIWSLFVIVVNILVFFFTGSWELHQHPLRSQMCIQRRRLGILDDQHV